MHSNSHPEPGEDLLGEPLRADGKYWIRMQAW